MSNLALYAVAKENPMSNPTKTLAFNVPMAGDMSKETWPAYLSDAQYAEVVMAAISSCHLTIERCRCGYNDGLVRFIVGDHGRSRKLVVNCKERGIVYLLQDDGSDWDDDIMKPPTTVAVRAITIGELTGDKYSSVVKYLELDKHRNARLAR